MRGLRTNFAGRVGPGPGEYDPQFDCRCRGEPIDEEGERVQFESFIPRFTDQLVIEQVKEVGVEGSGTFRIPVLFPGLRRFIYLVWRAVLELT